MGAGASAQNDGSGLRELNEEFEKRMKEKGEETKKAEGLDTALAGQAKPTGWEVDPKAAQRSAQRGWTVSVGASALRTNQQEADDMAARKQGRSHSTPAMTQNRRESGLEFTEEDREDILKREEYIKGRVRRGSLFLGEVQQPTLQQYYTQNATVMLYGKFGNSKPFGETEMDTMIEGSDITNEGIESLLKVGISSIKGKKGGSDSGPSQDNFSITHLKTGHEIFCCMDGHGKCGHNVSYRTVRTLPYYISTSVFFPDEIEKTLVDAFELCQYDLMGNSLSESYDAQGSGTTATCCIRLGNTVWSAHIGDSRVAVGDKASKVTFESEDHKPEKKEEQDRIVAAGGEVRSFKYEDDWTVHRMFIKGRNYPGLCMSRSFGDDCVKEHGVSAVPEVTKVELDPENNSILILASDGVWEFLGTSWVIRAVMKAIPGKGLMKCAKKLTRESKHRWKDEEGDYCDDITALIIQCH